MRSNVEILTIQTSNGDTSDTLSSNSVAPRASLKQRSLGVKRVKIGVIEGRFLPLQRRIISMESIRPGVGKSRHYLLQTSLAMRSAHSQRRKQMRKVGRSLFVPSEWSFHNAVDLCGGRRNSSNSLHLRDIPLQICEGQVSAKNINNNGFSTLSQG